MIHEQQPDKRNETISGKMTVSEIKFIGNGGEALRAQKQILLSCLHVIG